MKKEYLFLLSGILLAAIALSVIPVINANPAIPNPGHGTSDLEGDADFNMNNNKIINLTTPVASSDAATKGYVDSSGGDDVSAVVAVAEIPGSPYSLNWDAIQVCQFGTCCPPWRDCDGDGKTYSASTDCDEGCATCYVGSTNYTSSPDGKDQDCDGEIDEGSAPSTKNCPGVGYGFRSMLISTCQSYCSGLGKEYTNMTCTITTGDPGASFTSYDWSTCNYSGYQTAGSNTYCTPNSGTCSCGGYK